MFMAVALTPVIGCVPQGDGHLGSTAEPTHDSEPPILAALSADELPAVDGFLVVQSVVADGGPAEWPPWAYMALDEVAIPSHSFVPSSSGCAIRPASGPSEIAGVRRVGRTVPLTIGGVDMTLRMDTERIRGQTLYTFDVPYTSAVRAPSGGALHLAPYAVDMQMPDVPVPDIHPEKQAEQVLALVRDGKDIGWKPSQNSDDGSIVSVTVYMTDRTGAPVVGVCSWSGGSHGAVRFPSIAISEHTIHLVKAARVAFAFVQHPELGSLHVHLTKQVDFKARTSQ